MKSKLLAFIRANRLKVAEYLAMRWAEASAEDGAVDELYDHYFEGCPGINDSTPEELMENIWDSEVTEDNSDSFEDFKNNVLNK